MIREHEAFAAMDGPVLFLSYNSVDRHSVVAVRKLLTGRGITTFLDLDQLVPGLPWPSALEQALRRVRGVAVFIGQELGGWQKKEMYFALDRQVREEKQGRSFPVIPVLLPGADPTPSFLFLNTWVDLRGGLDSVDTAGSLDAFEHAVTATAPVKPSAVEEALALCPYRGLEAFREEHAAFFVGRAPFANELFKFTLGKDLVAVVGPSGSGKSSVVQAGLVPLLRRQVPPETTWDMVTFTPGADPFLRMASCLVPLLEPTLTETDRLKEAHKLGEGLEKDEIKIEAVIDRVIEKSNGTGRLLVVADQFEELFTLTAEPKRRLFAKGSVRALGKARFTLLITLRADFYSQIITLDRELSDRLAPAQVNIGALTSNELRESITVPAKLVGWEFEPGLVDRILNDVGREPGNLPLLEFALTGLWSERPDRILTNDAYDKIGGVAGALAQRAEAEFARFGTQEQTAVRRLFSRLVRVARPEEGTEDTRQRIELQGTDPLTEKVAQALAGPEVRLLVMGSTESEATDGGRTVEVAHEALIRNWERLRSWLNEDREFLLWRQRTRIQVDEWEQHRRDASYLLRGISLSEAERWLDRRPQDLMDVEQQFIQAAVGLRDREREEQERRRKAEIIRLRWFSGVLTVMILIALGAALYATRQQSIARQQQLIAESRALAAQAEEMVIRDQAAALALAVRAWQTANTPEAHNAVSKSLAQPSSILRGHTEHVWSAEFSPDGQRIVTASEDNTARVWNGSGEPLATLQGHTDAVLSAVFSPDGQRIVTASRDLTARVWNVDGKLQSTLQSHGIVRSAVFSPDGQRIVTASDDGTARVWNVANGQLLATLKSGFLFVFSAVFSPNGQCVVTAGNDGTARVWNVANGQLLTTLQGQTAMVVTASFSPDGQRILTASDDKTAQVWSATTGQLLAVIRHTDQVFSAEFSPDGQRIVTASFDRTARLWDASGQPLATLQGHNGPVRRAVFSPDGRFIVTASDDHTARVWNVANGQLLATLQGHVGAVGSAVFSPDGERVVTASDDGTARVWNASGQVVAAVLQGHTEPVLRAVFSPDGERIVTAGRDKTARVWNASGQLLATLQGHSEWVLSAVFSPDGQQILTASLDHTARVWNISGKLQSTLQSHDIVRSAVFSPDGQRIVTASDDHTARVWNISGQLQFTLQGHSFVRSAVFSPDGQRIVTTSDDHTPQVWNAANGQLLATLQGYTAVFSPDGRRIVTVSGDNTTRVWNANSGQLLATFQGTTWGVFSAEFSPDSQRIVFACNDNSARVWKVSGGQLLATLLGHTGPVTSAVFSPDGQRILTASEDKTARVFRLVTLSEIADLLAK